jgi:hypothetical protein
MFSTFIQCFANVPIQHHPQTVNHNKSFLIIDQAYASNTAENIISSRFHLSPNKTSRRNDAKRLMPHN